VSNRQRRPYVAKRIRERTGRDLPDALTIALIENDYSSQRAADFLEMNRSTFYRLCRRYGVHVVNIRRVAISTPAA
jgi:DNA-binding NtrC family response regulator